MDSYLKTFKLVPSCLTHFSQLSHKFLSQIFNSTLSHFIQIPITKLPLWWGISWSLWLKWHSQDFSNYLSCFIVLQNSNPYWHLVWDIFTYFISPFSTRLQYVNKWIKPQNQNQNKTKACLIYRSVQNTFGNWITFIYWYMLCT